jgi:hypothetical protein
VVVQGTHIVSELSPGRAPTPRNKTFLYDLGSVQVLPNFTE